MITKTKAIRMLACTTLTCGMLAASLFRVSAQTDQDLIEVARGVIKADRQTIVASTMKLTEAESKAFWPLYHEYRFEMDKVSDKLMKLVLAYAKDYPDVPEDRAKQWLKDYMDLQQEQVNKRTAYLKKFSKVLPADKTLRFAQVETRLDLLAHLQLAANVPLVPANGDK